MNRIQSNEFIKRGVAPIVALALGFAACSSSDSKTVQEQTEALHTKAVQLCTDEAKVAFNEAYPSVSVGNNPSSEELKKALEIVEGRETDGPALMQDKFEDCMNKNFNNPVQDLIDQQIQVSQSTTVVAETTAVTVQG